MKPSMVLLALGLATVSACASDIAPPPPPTITEVEKSNGTLFALYISRGTNAPLERLEAHLRKESAQLAIDKNASRFEVVDRELSSDSKNHPYSKTLYWLVRLHDDGSTAPILTSYDPASVLKNIDQEVEVIEFDPRSGT